MPKKIKTLTNNNTTTSTPKLGKFNTLNHSKKEEKKNEIKEEKKNEIKIEKKNEIKEEKKNKITVEKKDEEKVVEKNENLKEKKEEQKTEENEKLSIKEIQNNSKKQEEKKASAEIYLPLIIPLLNKISKILPQYKMNGYHNIWIMKPSCLSRGRDIQCINSLSKIKKNIAENNINYVLQKYIENPLIIHNKKFDIRQWVLITSIHPLTIWKWEEPYFRFSAENYDINNISNIYSHLTNNSIAKYSQKFNSDNLIKEDMWDLTQFRNYLYEKYKKDLWDEIDEKIKKAIICSFDSGRHEIGYRENSHELYGYDFMIDEDFNVYLIEINSSPAMDYSTSITGRLVKEMLGNIIQIVIDHKDNNENCDKIGKYLKIYNGKEEINEKFLPNK